MVHVEENVDLKRSSFIAFMYNILAEIMPETRLVHLIHYGEKYMSTRPSSGVYRILTFSLCVGHLPNS